MAFLLAPRFAPAYAQQCGPWSSSTARPSYRRACRASRPAAPSFVPFLSQISDFFEELDSESHKEAQQQPQRRRVVRAHFNVHEHNGGYQIDGEIPGFEQDNLDIEVTDDNTVKIVGDTEKNVGHDKMASAAFNEQVTEDQAADEAMDGVTLNEPAQTATDAGTPTHSDTASHKSFNATVEDGFEDLAAETASAVSASPDHSTESKGKEKAADESVVAANHEPTVTESKPHISEDRFYGSFERTFRFPERIDASQTKASLKNGLLSIRVPKAKAPEVKRIFIQ